MAIFHSYVKLPEGNIYMTFAHFHCRWAIRPNFSKVSGRFSWISGATSRLCPSVWTTAPGVDDMPRHFWGNSFGCMEFVMWTRCNMPEWNLSTIVGSFQHCKPNLHVLVLVAQADQNPFTFDHMLRIDLSFVIRFCHFIYIYIYVCVCVCTHRYISIYAQWRFVSAVSFTVFHGHGSQKWQCKMAQMNSNDPGNHLLDSASAETYIYMISIEI